MTPSEEDMTHRFERLTTRQRECLRLFERRMSAKEIADALGISPHVVNEHLAAARRVLGVGRSAEAARLLREHEETPYPLGGYPSGVAPMAPDAMTGASTPVEGVAPQMELAEPAILLGRPVRRSASLFSTLFATLETRRDDLTAGERIALGLLCGFLAVLLVGAMMMLQRALS